MNSNDNEPHTEPRIDDILKENMLDDLKNAIKTRKRLNMANTYLIYIYHVFQTMGIILNAMAINSEHKQYLSYVGIGCNAIASFVNMIEKTNSNLAEKLLRDIKDIKEGNYIDEGTVEDDEKNSARE